MTKITLIAPYQSLGELAVAVCREHNWSVEVMVGRGTKGVDLARQAERRGARVIISRGITADQIRTVVNLPVIEIPITGFDMLRSYLQARAVGTPVGVIDKKSIIEGFTSLAEMMGEKILTFELKDEREIKRAVHFLEQEGVKVIIGKATVTRLVEAHKLKGILLTSGKEAIVQAVEEALRVLDIRQQEMAKLQEIRAILEFNSDAIIVIDGNGRISAFNPVAEKLLNRPKQEVMGLPVSQVLPWSVISRVFMTGKAEFGELVNVGDYQVALNCIPVLVVGQIKGMIINFQDVQHIQKVEQKIRRNLLNRGHIAKYTFEDIIGESVAIQEVVKRARKFSQVDSTVLIYGETGCGKEMFAQAMHDASPRRDGPFVAVNCAALPESLLESELFGYVDGAFTGARKGGKPGLFELAHNGTLFLDEIGEMSERLQARVLRVLEEAQVMRLGADRFLPINVRIIAATNRDLKQMVLEKRFREDLYYRIHVLSLNIPPLRAREEDIPLLFRYFVKECCGKFKKDVREVDPLVFGLLKQYRWPGNVRELKNVVERLVLLADGPVITVAMVQDVLSDQGCILEDTLPLSQSKNSLLYECERVIIEKVLAATGGNRSEAARRLGIGRTTLWRKLKKQKPLNTL